MSEYAPRELFRHRPRTAAHIAVSASAAAIFALVLNVFFNGEAALRGVPSGTNTHFVVLLAQCSDETCASILRDAQHEGFYRRTRIDEGTPRVFLEIEATVLLTTPKQSEGKGPYG